METLYPMNKKELKEELYRLLNKRDGDTAVQVLYYAAMKYGALGSDLLDELTPAQVRRLEKAIRRAEEQEFVPNDAEMEQVRLLVSNYYAEPIDEFDPNVLREPEGKYRSPRSAISEELTPGQLEHIRESIAQLERGEFYTHEEVQQKVREWLSK